MHPDIMWRLAADHIRELITEAGEARRAHEARHGRRRRLVAHLRRSTRLAAQQLGSRRDPGSRSRGPRTAGWRRLGSPDEKSHGSAHKGKELTDHDT